MDALANPEEVQRVFAMPLRIFLMQDEHSSRDTVMSGGDQHPDIPYRLHFFQQKNLPTCWGLTAGKPPESALCLCVWILHLFQFSVPMPDLDTLAGILIEVAKLAFGQDPQFEEQLPGCRAYSDIWHNGEHVLYRDRL